MKLIKKKCKECGKLFVVKDKSDLWCASCRGIMHAKLMENLSVGLKDDYWTCPKCRIIVKLNITSCPGCGRPKP